MIFHITEETREELVRKIEYLEAKEPFIQYVRWKAAFGEWKAYNDILKNCEIIKKEEHECESRD